MLKIAIPVLPKVFDASLAITLDVLGAANRLRQASGKAPAFEPVLVGFGRTRVRTGAGLAIGPLQPPSAADGARWVVVPGANVPTPDEVDAWLASAEARRAARWLRAQAALGATITASCVGSFLLAEAGLLEGQEATTTWWLAPHFRARFPLVTLDMQRMVVPSARCWTAGAALAQADLMLALVAHTTSPDLAHACARHLLLDGRTSQSRYAIAAHLAHQSPLLRKAERWLRARLAEPLTVQALADALHTTPRTLARRFATELGLTPLAYIHQLRVERAVHLLETTKSPIDDIAQQVGYADRSMLRRLLARSRGTTPAGVRRERIKPAALAPRPAPRHAVRHA